MQFRNRLIAATSTFALAIAGTALAEEANEAAGPITSHSDISGFGGDISGFGGDISGFGGDISGFWGDISGFWGDISGFGGDISGFGGDISGFGGDISGFWGDISGFGGDISGFGGDISGFWGDISGFWGDISGFGGDISGFGGDISGFAGDISGFGGDISGFWGDISGFWFHLDEDSSDEDVSVLIEALDFLFNSAQGTFGEMFEANVGESYDEGFRLALMEKYGLDASDPNTFRELTDADKAMFFMEFHDVLMTNTGFDFVDYWMPQINWSPSMSQAAGGGYNHAAGYAIEIGLMDTTAKNESISANLDGIQGYRNYEGATHGATVASIAVGQHDGYGVMGVAPDAVINQFNPFDETGTAGWDDIKKGIKFFIKEKSEIVNLSLGVDGYVLHKDWYDIFADNNLNKYKGGALSDILFVKAAGNAGVTQEEDILWDGLDLHNRLILVGSVNSNNEISAFSNRPGEACFLDEGQCTERLMNRFLVAPGELILVQDNNNDIYRVSGTSIATPMVTGAAALVMGNWEWLFREPEAVSHILLQSATDLGAPGPDPVYGMGLLNVGAALQPLNQDDLYAVLSHSYGWNTYQHKVKISHTGLSRGFWNLRSWDEEITVFEDVLDTHRDFTVPVSVLEMDGSASAYWALGNGIYGDFYIESSSGNVTYCEANKVCFNSSAFNNLNTHAVQMFGGEGSDWRLSMTAQNRDIHDVTVEGAVPFTTGMTLENKRTGLRLSAGSGNGMMALTGQDRFTKNTDYDVNVGGVNPILGLAAGGTYAAGEMPVSERMKVTFGYTQKTDEHQYKDDITGQMVERNPFLSDYRSNAMTMGLSYDISDNMDVRFSYTALNEETGLLGAQGTGVTNLDDGTRTDAMSMDVSAQVTPSFSLAASATVAKTRSNERTNSLLSVEDEGLTTTSFALVAEQAGVFGKKDRLRASIAQPLTVQNGGLVIYDTQVVDRTTGELGLVEKNVDLSDNDTRYVTELLYARPVFDDNAELSLFGLAQSHDLTTENNEPSVSGGVRLKVNF